ncbi:molybdenum cofactor carrier [Nocardioides gansuensis]|uniref:Molybdenum cofactor carrier n=1 Tax=Nocardioides gansuensis TaxID=2138300 RepID=A0A2T8F7Z3_9ACTN|nr:molybdenum cofactor carrier [Nocardioides gansuensis]
MPSAVVVRLVSGGQTGADRAALEVAVRLGLEYGGWVPRGGWAEDLPTPPGVMALFPALREAPSADPAERTRLNVRDSDATLVLRGEGVASPGTDLTVAVAQELGRPCLVTPGDAAEVAAWLADVHRELGRGLVLNVAGPRESTQPGIHQAARDLLLAVLPIPHADDGWP